jgi:hypothetical protein
MQRFVIAVLANIYFLIVSLAMPHGIAHADTIVECDITRLIGANWQRTQSAINTTSVVCYQLSGALVLSQLQPTGNTLQIQIRVTKGAVDAFVFPVGGAATELNPAPIAANTGWQSYAYPSLTNANTDIAVVPAVDGQRVSYQLRLRAGPIVPPPLPPVPTPGGPIILQTTTDKPCSTAGVNLSDLCIDPYPVAPGGTAYAVWRIGNFVSGDFDKGDGQGFKGPIASQMRVDIPNVTAPRLVQLKWIDSFGRTFIDSIIVAVSGQAPAPTPVDTFPCSRPGINVSNLCIEQPYPVKRGTSAFAVWRIASFKSGEFDKGDGQGFKGPINAEQRVEIPNITGPRTIRLRWTDLNNQLREDSFTIQVVD